MAVKAAFVVDQEELQELRGCVIVMAWEVELQAISSHVALIPPLEAEVRTFLQFADQARQSSFGEEVRWGGMGTKLQVDSLERGVL